jgi:hypothetical protein
MILIWDGQLGFTHPIGILTAGIPVITTIRTMVTIIMVVIGALLPIRLLIILITIIITARIRPIRPPIVKVQ